ncbi:class I adenylate-forming enzyme family protein [Streptantibioticus silvisoli]|uniref:Class I adenylate-forming enzyme family protein n=1 Tax=Streptantibioticus silvisoli TaxID=2705255 RepID=A0ABT6VRY5_9ACTN|nr:class I adenylate-forming enzyme family protein [Streptantibioticus silvisoli]MDI5961241.1 class I adenylate-forming enzyme family protein [Streptantibioticus silvisoli]
MSAKTIRAQLASDPAVGAGNVLTTLMALDTGLDVPLITFDSAIDTHRAGEALTVRQLDRAVRARAAALHAEGIRPRDPVAVWAGTAADHVLSFLALARLGAIPALVNPRLDPDKAVIYIGRLRAAAVLADTERHALLTGRDTGAPLLPDLSAPATHDPADAPEPYRHWADDPVAITHSSGTTGLPKAVVHSHASLYAAVRHRLSLPRPQGSERMLSVLPAPHAATLIAVNLALSTHAEISLLSSQTGDAVLEAIESWQPRGVIGFATTWADLARHDLGARRTGSVALWWNTGDCAHEAHIRRLIAAGSRQSVTRQGRVTLPGSVFVDGLGSTEMGHSHFFITHTPDTERYGRCVGRPHAFVDCAVLGPDGEELPAGQVGELGTRSPTLALGYWNDSVTTYRTRVRGYFLTGDLVYRDEEGYYYHLDRAVDAVDLGGGRRLYTAVSEEAVLAACPDILDCTFVALREDGRVVTDVLVQPRDGADPGRDWAKEVAAALPPEVAATLREVTTAADGRIPLGPTGKVRKVLLRDRHSAQGGAR